MSQNLLLYFFVLRFQTNQYFDANLYLDFNEQNYSCGGDLILKTPAALNRFVSVTEISALRKSGISVTALEHICNRCKEKQ